jgi:hypothetical protein
VGDFYNSSDDSQRLPKEIYACIAKGRDPETNRAKTWVRVHTSKADAKNTHKLWTKYKFLDVKVIVARTQWEDLV